MITICLVYTAIQTDSCMSFSLSEFGESVCLSGPPSCGKTSLLFQHALATAEAGGRVLFLAPAPLERLPLLEKASSQQQPSPVVVKRIQFRYPSTLNDLLGVFDSIHLPAWTDQQGGYDAVIIDNFNGYFSLQQVKGHDLTGEVARTCAHIIDAVKYLSECRSFFTAGNRVHRVHGCMQKKKLRGKAGYEATYNLISRNSFIPFGTGELVMSVEVPEQQPAAGCTVAVSVVHPFHGLKLEILQRWFPVILQILNCDENQYSVRTWSPGDNKHSQQASVVNYTLSPSCMEYITPFQELIL